MTLHPDRIELRGLFDGMAAKWRPTIVESGNEFAVEPPAAGEVLIDASKLRRVVENLLSNAAKFTKNGRITFSASIRADFLTMSVEDTGAGISEKQISRLFETFDRSEDETASNYGDDVRLGLPLAHRYCRLMGGELSVQSKLGSGSRFVVQLPIPALSERKQSAPRLELLTEAA
jgi:signal transduction histidine kinase